MVYKFIYTKTAERDLDNLPKQEAIRILKKMQEYASRENPLDFARKLKGIITPTYRFRVGHYRIIFRLDPKTKQLVFLVILKIAHRKNVY